MSQIVNSEEESFEEALSQAVNHRPKLRNVLIDLNLEQTDEQCSTGSSEDETIYEEFYNSDSEKENNVPCEKTKPRESRYERWTSDVKIQEDYRAFRVKTCCRRGCYQKLTIELMRLLRHRFATKGEKQQRQCILDEITQSPLLEPKLFIDGQRVCISTWCLFHGCSTTRFYEILQLARKYGFKANVAGSRKGVKNVSAKRIRARNWMNTMCSIGEILPDDDKTVYLPCCFSRKELYATYISDTKGGQVLGYTAFRKMWKEDFKHVKISRRKGSFTKCGVCVLLKDLTTASTNPDRRKRLLQKKTKHIEQQQAERQKYYHHIAKARKHPHKYISIISDAMDQSKTNIPHWLSKSKSNKDEFLKTHVTGLLSHGTGTCYQFIDLMQWAHDSNLVMNTLYRVLVDIATEQRLSPVLYLQLDNCWRENKNRYIFAFLAWLVQKDVVRKVKLSFLMVGHTHEDIDQMFSRNAVQLHKENAVTLPQLEGVFRKAYTPRPTVTTLRFLFDFKGFLSKYIANIRNHSKPHAFKFEKTASGQVGITYKNWAADEGWLPRNINGDREQPLLILNEEVPQNDFPLPLQPEFDVKNDLETMRKEATTAAARMTESEMLWWKEFLQQQESTRSFWKSLTTGKKRSLSRKFWDNMILKPYLEERAPESDPDEQRREDEIDEMIKNTENFKQVCKMNWQC
eukprot:gene8448-14434_t